MHPRSGGRLINWPHQHYENGVAKNAATARSYKGCVRILKTLRYAMIADGIASAESATSFLMECLIWNVPNDRFGASTWTSEMRNCLAWLFNSTTSIDDCGHWGEVSELKYLFGSHQAWTRPGAHRFISDAWDYLGFDR